MGGDDDNSPSSQRKRRGIWPSFPPQQTEEAAEPTCSASPSAAAQKRRRGRGTSPVRDSEPREDDIKTLQTKIGSHQHHGTGNPLAVRSPSTPKTLAVDNLAEIIQAGRLGRESSDSTPKLKTERGDDGSFWTVSVELAGQYGWTGMILPPDVKSDKPFPIEGVEWFLVEDETERQRLESILGATDDTPWEAVKERVVTVSQLAAQLKEESH